MKTINTTLIQNNTYDIQMYSENEKFIIQVNILNGIYTTKDFPNTLEVLKNKAPEVFDTICLNDNELSFYEEVQDTEIAHLLEHLILMNLKMARVKNNQNNVIFNGYTEWDWEKLGEGVYNVVIEGTNISEDEISSALAKSLVILEEIVKVGALVKEGALVKVEA